MITVKMAVLVLLCVVFLLSVSEVISECPPSSGKTLDVYNNCLGFIGIYLMRDGDCYPNESYFWDANINSDTDYKRLSCVLPGANLTTGQWVRVADPLDPVDCDSNNDGDPFRCTTVTSPDATISLYLPSGQGLPEPQEGFYKCCLPTNCSSATNTITVNIFSKKV